MIKKRNILVQILLYIITIGIYGFYWFYVTTRDMLEYKKLSGSAALWTVLMFIPLVNFYAEYKHSWAVESFTDKDVNKWLIFVCWILFAPAALIVTQLELNKRAS